MRLDFVSRSEQVDFVRRAILGRETGTIVITGEPGIGRTTFLACAVGSADPARDEIVLLNSSSDPSFMTLRRNSLPRRPTSAPDVAATALSRRTGRRFVIAVDDVHPTFLGAFVATTVVAGSSGVTYPGLAQLVGATQDAWRQLSLGRTEVLCRLALHCGARDEIAPIWSMLLLLRGRTRECLAFLGSLDFAGQMPPRLAVVQAMALAFGFGQVDEASGHLLASASSDGRPPEFLLAFRAWVLAISGRESTVTNALANLSRQDRTTALFVHAARAMQSDLRAERGESVFHLRRAIASAEADGDDYPWMRPYLQAVLIDALIVCGRVKEAVSAARRFHAHEPSSGWEIAASIGALMANQAFGPRLS
jgi:hypothetical protein